MTLSGDGGTLLLTHHHHFPPHHHHPAMLFNPKPLQYHHPSYHYAQPHPPPPPMPALFRRMGPPPPPPPPAHFAFAAHEHRPRHRAPSSPPAESYELRDVWAWNLAEEMAAITAQLPAHPVVCVDTEFPGAVHDSPTPRHLRSPDQAYALVRRNADDLKHLLQLGVALAAPGGRRHRVVWQFNFRGFDEANDPHSPASIAMLKDHGMDFAALREDGIHPDDFAAEFARSGLARSDTLRLTWVAFSGSYDFAYLAKVLRRGKDLPEKLDDFQNLVARLFGPRVIDVKYLTKTLGVHGGLEQVAATLGVDRAAGRAHNAGSDSLLTAEVMHAIVWSYIGYVDVRPLLAGAIDGLAEQLDVEVLKEFIRECVRCRRIGVWI